VLDWIEDWRHRRWVAVLGDILLVIMVLLLSLKGLRETNGCPCPPVPNWGYLLVAVQALVLLGRRWWPVTVALISGVLALFYGVSTLPDPPVPYAALVAIYTAAAHAPRRRAIVVAVISAAEIAIAMIVDRARSDFQDALFSLQPHGCWATPRAPTPSVPRHWRSGQFRWRRGSLPSPPGQ
jgi:hypothetical protein